MHPESHTDTNTQQKNQRYGLLIMAIILLPMLLAYIMFYTGWGVSGHTTNKGDLLLPPQQIQALGLAEHGDWGKDGESQRQALIAPYSSGDKKWRMLIPVPQDCDQRCENHLYLSRQVHIRLAEKAHRVQRILLLLAPPSVEKKQALEREHPNSLFLQSTPAELNRWLQATALPEPAEHYFYLIDQEGFAMMRYSRHHSGQDVLDDLKKLLKFTYSK